MYTSGAFLILIAQGVAGPEWVTDYGQARETGQKQSRPLAVFLGSGPEGYLQVSRDSTLTPRIRDLLAQRYVCVYLDVSQPGPRRLAEVLEITRGRGLVISDRSGQVQAFHHDGDLTEAELTRNLERFANTDNPVRSTASNDHVAYYSPPVNSSPIQYAPIFRGGGRGC